MTFLLLPGEGQRPVYDDYIVSHRKAAARAAPELGFAIPTVGQPYPRSSLPPQLVALHVQESAPEKLEALEEAIFRAVFVGLEDVASREVLERCVASVGLAADVVATALGDARLRERALREHAAAEELGINGIPALLVPGWGPIVGAVPVDVYRRALKAAAKRG